MTSDISALSIFDTSPHPSTDAFLQRSDFLRRALALVSSLNEQYPARKPAFMLDPTGDQSSFVVTYPADLQPSAKATSQWENAAATFGLTLR